MRSPHSDQLTIDHVACVARDSWVSSRKSDRTIGFCRDSNVDDATTPADVYYGTAVHDEILNFKECGLANDEILADATSRPAEYFEQPDRGTIEDGKTADLLLVDGDLEHDLSAIRNVSAVWYKGEKKV